MTRCSKASGDTKRSRLTRIPDFTRSLQYKNKEFFLDSWELKRLELADNVNWWSVAAKEEAEKQIYKHLDQLHDTALGILDESEGRQSKTSSLLICGIYFTVFEWDRSRTIKKDYDMPDTNLSQSILDPNSKTSEEIRSRPPITPQPQPNRSTQAQDIAQITPLSPDSPEASELPTYSDDRKYASMAETYLKNIKKETILHPVIKQFNACAIVCGPDGKLKLTNEFLCAIFAPVETMSRRLGMEIAWTRQASWLDLEADIEPSAPTEEVWCSSHER